MITSPYHGFVQIDSQGFIQEAYDFINSGRVDFSTIMQLPQFPEIPIAIIIKLTGSHAPILVLNIAIHFITSVYIYKICEKTSGHRLGAIAASIFVLYPIHYIWVSQVHRDGYILLSLTILIWQSINDKKSLQDFMKAAVFYCIAFLLVALNRGYLLLLFFMLTIALILVTGNLRIRRIGLVSLCFLTIVKTIETAPNANLQSSTALLPNSIPIDLAAEDLVAKDLVAKDLVATDLQNNSVGTDVQSNSVPKDIQPDSVSTDLEPQPFTSREINRRPTRLQRYLPIEATCQGWKSETGFHLTPKIISKLTCSLLITRIGSINAGGNTLVAEPALYFASDLFLNLPQLTLRSMITPTYSDLNNVGLNGSIAFLISFSNGLLTIIGVFAGIIYGLKKSPEILLITLFAFAMHLITWIAMPNVGTYIRIISPYHFILITLALSFGFERIKKLAIFRSPI